MFKGLKALLAGLLAGTALGILFSPKKGEDIRKNFKKEINSGGTGLNTLKDTVVGLGKEIGDSAKDTFEEVSETETYKQGVKKAQDYSGMAKEQLNKMIKEKTTSTQRKKAKEAFKKAKTAINKAASKIADKTND